jgi:hypothetical protein
MNDNFFRDLNEQNERIHQGRLKLMREKHEQRMRMQADKHALAVKQLEQSLAAPPAPAPKSPQDELLTAINNLTAAVQKLNEHHGMENEVVRGPDGFITHVRKVKPKVH